MDDLSPEVMKFPDHPEALPIKRNTFSRKGIAERRCLFIVSKIKIWYNIAEFMFKGNL